MLLLCAPLFSCSNDDDTPAAAATSPGSISLQYRGEKIIFDEVKVEFADDASFDYDVRVTAGIKFTDTNTYKYFLNLTFDKDGNNYVLHNFNFNVTQQLASKTFHLTNYYAALRGDLISTGFYGETQLSNENVFSGSFSGRLSSQAEGDIEISNGTFMLNLN